MKQNRQVFLLLCHFLSPYILKEYKKISKANADKGVTLLLYHQMSQHLPSSLNKYNHFLITDQHLHSLPYPMLGTSLVPGNTHFALLCFFQENPDYKYYWMIEYDVRFSGKWDLFFNSFNDFDQDLITGNICEYREEPQWYWWKLDSPKKIIPLEQRLKSFNPIFRVSREALAFIHNSHKNGWSGHQEVILPTLLYDNGYKIMDLGGEGRFVPESMINKYYILNKTYRYRPIFNKSGKEKNKLYHPVKPMSQSIYLKIISHFKKI